MFGRIQQSLAFLPITFAVVGALLGLGAQLVDSEELLAAASAPADNMVVGGFGGLAMVDFERNGTGASQTATVTLGVLTVSFPVGLL